MGGKLHRRLRFRRVHDHGAELILRSRRLHGQQRSEHARRERAARRSDRHAHAYLPAELARSSIDESRGGHVHSDKYVHGAIMLLFLRFIYLAV